MFIAKAALLGCELPTPINPYEVPPVIAHDIQVLFVVLSKLPELILCPEQKRVHHPLMPARPL
jgi:hypothetical protein